MMEFAIVKNIIQLMITIGLTIYDMVSDIILAADYASTGEDDHDWWFALTLTFFLLPLLPLFLLLLLTFVIYVAEGCSLQKIKDTNEAMAKFFHLWKQFECVAESGPQLILQLYILAVSSMDHGTNREMDLANTTMINITNTPEDFTTSSEWYSTNPTVNVSVQTTMDTITGNNNVDEAFTFPSDISVSVVFLWPS